MGITSGIPLYLILSTLFIWLTREDIDISTIGLFALTQIPWSIKFLWAPIIDSFRIPLLHRLLGQRKAWLFIIQINLILFIILIISSSGMYLVEKDIQPEKFGSIPQSMWWSIVTLTTVGYGDVYPATSMGKFFGSIIIILGIGTVALPSGILASAFTEHTKRNQKKYENQLKLMLSDNVIDEGERKELKELSERLNLSDEDILAIEEHYKNKK